VASCQNAASSLAAAQGFTAPSDFEAGATQGLKNCGTAALGLPVLATAKLRTKQTTLLGALVIAANVTAQRFCALASEDVFLISAFLFLYKIAELRHSDVSSKE
jgi:hypothetical protein